MNDTIHNWEYINLGEAATFVNGYPFKPEQWSNNGLEIIRIQNLTKGSCTTNYFKGEIPNKYKIRHGDLLISWSATLGIFMWKSADAWLNQHIFKVVFDKKEFNKQFFKHLIANSLQKMSEQVHGATMKHITKKKFDAFVVPYPPLAEQKKIAAILDAADRLRQKDAQLIAKYNELSQSLFLDMFGDPVTNPMGWEVKRVGQVLCKKSQNGLYLTKDKYKPTGIGMVHMSDAFYGVVSTEQLKTVVLTNDELEKYQLSENDLLLARRSLTYEGAAKPCRIPKSDKALVYESSLIKVTPNLNVINTLYLYFFFSNARAKNKYVNKYISRSTISGINNKGLNAIQIIVPYITLQNQFAERIQHIEAQNQQAQAALQKSDDLFHSLLQRAFKGELTEQSKTEGL